MRPPSAVAAHARGVALEQGVLGLGVEGGGRLVEHEDERLVAHEPAGQRQLLPLPEAHLDALGPGRAELGVEPGVEALDDVVGPGPLDRRDDGRLVVERGTSPRPTLWLARSSKRKKSWNAPARRARQPVGRHARQVDAVDEDAAARRLVELGEQLHERGLAGAVLPHDRDHRAGRQRRADTSWSTSRSVPG